MWIWSRYSFLSKTECLPPPSMCICVHEHKHFFKSMFIPIKSNACRCKCFSVSFSLPVPCKTFLLKPPSFTPRVLLKIIFTPISSSVFLVPHHFYPPEIHTHARSHNGTQAMELFLWLWLSTERWRTETSRLSNRCERKPGAENSMEWKCHHSYCYLGMAEKQRSSAPDQTLELIVRLQKL